MIRERSISFEEVAFAIQNDKILDIIKHANPGRYKNQKMYVIEWNGYAYLVPFVQDGDSVFLKTVIPSRKATKAYLKEKNR